MTTFAGQCLCGAVTVKATPEADRMDVCHCSMCRKWSAGPMMAFGCGDNVEFEGAESLAVYKSSQWAERVFCKNCGTSVAWRLQSGGGYHVSAQLFDDTETLPLGLQVFIDDKPANYSFAEKTKTMTGAEIFAMFAPSESGNDA